MADETRSFQPGRRAAAPGISAEVNLSKLCEKDVPENDWGEAEPGAQHGQTHTRWAEKGEGDRIQGAKTRARNKQINSGRPFG